MAISSAPRVSGDLQPSLAAIRELLGQESENVSPLDGGRNSRVFKIECGDARYVAKIYPALISGQRDRMEAEWRALQFLRSTGVVNVTRPVVISWSHRCALYEYVEGQSIAVAGVTRNDIAQAIDFLKHLRLLSEQPAASRLFVASEACFSGAAVVDSIAGRLNRLRNDEKGYEFAELNTFLERDFRPLFSELSTRCERMASSWGLTFRSEIPTPWRTLSPSDFGFHNVLRRSGGELVFLDFEHFGWDDPAKMIVDFLLHPHERMAIGSGLRQTFLDGILNYFPESEELVKRVQIAYPLFGLKWCMVLLNEFVPTELQRRPFASSAGPEDIRCLRLRQLDKARTMLDRVGEHRGFPYRI